MQGRQETPGVRGKFGLGMRNEAGQRLRVLHKLTEPSQNPNERGIIINSVLQMSKLK